MIKALRGRAAYANVHSLKFPSGETRGLLGMIDDEND